MASSIDRLTTAHQNGEKVMAIHYGCEGILDNSAPARVACIVTEQIDSQAVRGFSIANRSESGDDAERAMLDEFFGHVGELAGANWVHWNGSTAKYGFDALARRYEALTGVAPPSIVPPSKRFDLDEIFEEARGRELLPHPKLFTAARLNGKQPHLALSGRDEADAVSAGNISAVENSVEEKVKWLVRLADRAISGSLQTEEPGATPSPSPLSRIAEMGPSDASLVWSSLREPLRTLTFAKMKDTAAAAGLDTTNLAHLVQKSGGGASKSQLADAIDSLFTELPPDAKGLTASRMVAELSERCTGEGLHKVEQVLTKYETKDVVTNSASTPRATIPGPTPSPTVAPVIPIAQSTGQSLFLSHAVEDENLADLVVSRLLRLGLDVPNERIFYSSNPATGVPGGAGWFGWIEERLRDSQLVVALVTPTFLTKPFCLVETGAAWIEQKLEVLTFSDERGVLSSLQMLDARDSADLNAFADRVRSDLDVGHRHADWSPARDAFLSDPLLQQASRDGTDE